MSKTNTKVPDTVEELKTEANETMEAPIAVPFDAVKAMIESEVAKALAQERAKNDPEGTELKISTKETKEQREYSAELVDYFIPYVDGEEKEVTVGLNGKLYKIMKGRRVKIPRCIKEILVNSSVQTLDMQATKEALSDVELKL